ncbi:hypothetical protein [Ottowia cancrivicina]|uniref:Uncharacterized protein n=1 Tax=Ottowia cancrivicina TaxID=3040346 RepID=A0AAW6RJM4_9BURK|nr:hypothetical protein [Ottowia sp. 10c7w1]MDG9699039.1 hypothetical protein [Ottowia sp. 10c7w1]
MTMHLLVVICPSCFLRSVDIASQWFSASFHCWNTFCPADPAHNRKALAFTVGGYFSTAARIIFWLILEAILVLFAMAFSSSKKLGFSGIFSVV